MGPNDIPIPFVSHCLYTFVPVVKLYEKMFHCSTLIYNVFNQCSRLIRIQRMQLIYSFSITFLQCNLCKYTYLYVSRRVPGYVGSNFLLRYIKNKRMKQMLMFHETWTPYHHRLCIMHYTSMINIFFFIICSTLTWFARQKSHFS